MVGDEEVEGEGEEVKSGTDRRVDVGVTFEEERTYFTVVSFPLSSRFHWFFETARESFALTDKPSQFITRLVVRRDDISLSTILDPCGPTEIVEHLDRKDERVERIKLIHF